MVTIKMYQVVCFSLSGYKEMFTMVARRAQRAANRKKHLQIKKTTSPIWQHMRYKSSQHNQRKKKHCKEKKNTCKLRKQLHQLDNTCTANAHNTTKQRNVLQIKLFICLCCEHLHHLLSNWWKCFLDLLVLFLFACVFWSCSALSSLGHPSLQVKWIGLF